MSSVLLSYCALFFLVLFNFSRTFEAVFEQTLVSVFGGNWYIKEVSFSFRFCLFRVVCGS